VTALRLALTSGAAVYLAVVFFMFMQQRSLQYYPTNRGLTPQLLGLKDVNEVTIATADGERLIAWHAKAAQGLPTVLYFHGNAGEIGDRADRLSFYHSQGLGVLFVSYRGFGGSTGAISEKGLIVDAIAAYDWLASRVSSPKEIAVVGESLGTGVAVQLAAQRTVAAIALEAPYTSAADIAANIYWWLPVRFLMKDTFYSEDFIAAIKAPLLIQHGDRDELIPIKHARSLLAMAHEPKEMVVLPGAGHSAVNDPDVWAREVNFFRRHAGRIDR
jgi:hypothetical protein